MKRTLLALLMLLTLQQLCYAWSVKSIVGPSFNRLVEGQQVDLQRKLETLLPESEGYLITGPLDPDFAYDAQLLPLYEAVRVVCPDLQSYDAAVAALNSLDGLTYTAVYTDTMGLGDGGAGWRGWRAEVDWEGEPVSLLVNTINQTRFLIWMEQVRDQGWVTYERESRTQFARAVAAYFAAIDSGRVDAIPPSAAEFQLDFDHDIYAPVPDYVISGYQNYKDYLNQFRGINTDFAHGVVAFIPTARTMTRLVTDAPLEAFANKEQARIQEEYREFFERGGDLHSLQTLTSAGFDTLKSGEYFFAVSPSGKIRFGHELLREEVERIEAETGREAPRANHAFLFPGEAVLTAGAFFIDETQPEKLVAVSAGSGHYFYSNIQQSIYEDVSMRSDYYLLTLGHFFAALDSLGIAHSNVLIRKF